MTTVSRITIEDALARADLDEDAIYEDYSGRGMYGASCFGITHAGAREVLAFIAHLATIDEEAALLLAERATEDSMGRGTITYFPGVDLA